jgi:hypothetical protein
VNGGDKGGKELKYSSLETAFAELAFSILLKLSYEKFLRKALCEKQYTEVICRRHRRN